MGQLFGKDKRTISEHIGNIFKEGELIESVVVRKFRTTTQHGAMAGKTQEVDVNGYNLDVIISVGYRVKSPQGTQFPCSWRYMEYDLQPPFNAGSPGIAPKELVDLLRNQKNNK